MRTRKLNNWLLYSLLFSTVFSYAQNSNENIIDQIFYKVDAGDISLSYLGLIFGNIADLVGDNPMVMHLFKVFNAGILSALVLLVIYSSMFGLSSSAHDGGIVGSNRASPYAMGRAVFGFAILVPTASGYSLVQKMVMYVVVSGVMAANTAWGSMMDYYQKDAIKPKPDPVETALDFTILNNSVRNWEGEEVVGGSHYKYDLLKSSSLDGLLTKLDIATLNAISIIDSKRQASGSYLYDFVPSIEYELIREVGENVLKTEFTLKFGIGLDGQAEGKTARPNDILLFSIQSQSDDRVKDTLLHGSMTRYVETIFNKVWDDYSQTLKGPRPASMKGTAGDKAKFKTYREQAFEVLADEGEGAGHLKKDAPMSVGAAEEDWTIDARGWGWLGAGIYYLDFIEAVIEGNAEGVELSQFIESELYVPNSLVLLNYEFKYGNGGETKHIWKPRALILDPKGADINSWLSGLLESVSGASGRAKSTMPTADGINISQYLAPLGLVDTVTLWKPGPKVSTGALKIDSLSTIKLGYTMAKTVRDALIGNGTYGLESYGKKNVNQLKVLSMMGNKFISAVTTYWKESVKDIYGQIKDVQLAGLGITSAAVSAKGTIDYYLAARRDANLKVPSADATSTAGLVAGKTGVSIMSDVVAGLINFATTSAKAIVGVYGPLVNGLSVVYFVAGLILAVYIPFIPSLIFIFAVMAWLFSVVESMIASPLIALGVAHPEGHEVLAKSEQAVMLLLGVFLRPLLTLIGMVVGISLSFTAIKMFNMTFLTSIVVFMKSIESISPVISPGYSEDHIINMFFVAGLVVLYVYALMVIVEQCYAMIYLIPDRVLKWIGSPSEAAGSGIGAGAIHAVSSGVTQDVGSAGAGASSAGGGALQQDTNVRG
ncbi:DotA/TraY family protein [Candidatus Comchoanobacter bicostacola]|uniref:DotA/TraY family protein n=1 Tax=Candidatus Comchoanobacter bicostacola TaxID=2919598 RepID=A0ABY5DIH6_9GAMM|nr:DotA/TraY family protein [Candidatus Comchoanobacter bicostacola]UTC24418.1 DotA/TraY family protein [Candidatus Comchoanobacter bicostacola]